MRPTPEDMRTPAMELAMAFQYSNHVKMTVSKVGNKFCPRIYGTTADRFWGKISPEPTSGCWLWCGDDNENYGSFAITLNGRSRRLPAHNFSYRFLVGPVPDGMQVHHTCENKFCVNPDHLTLMTPGDNTRAIPVGMRGNNQIRTRCKYGHALEGENLAFDYKGNARCKTCARAYVRAYQVRNPRRKLTQLDKLKILAPRCQCACGCGRSFKSINEIEFDHIVAIRRGGKDVIENIQPLLEECHKRKTYGPNGDIVASGGRLGSSGAFECIPENEPVHQPALAEMRGAESAGYPT